MNTGVLLHHVAIEIGEGDLTRAREFWRLVGFTEVEPPGSVGPERAVWFEATSRPGEWAGSPIAGTQIHLLIAERPVVPPQGHVAIAVADYEERIAALAEARFPVDRRREHWGSPRAFCAHPGGHRVELMRDPPFARFESDRSNA